MSPIVCRYIFLLGGGGLMAAAGTSPEEAVSNLGAWVQFIGLDEVPKILSSQSADSWGMAIGGAMVLVGILSFFIRRHPADEIDDSESTSLYKKEAADILKQCYQDGENIASECEDSFEAITNSPPNSKQIYEWEAWFQEARETVNKHVPEEAFMFRTITGSSVDSYDSFKSNLGKLRLIIGRYENRQSNGNG